MKDKMTGGVRMQMLIDKGIPFRGGVYLDTYNQMYSDICGMVKARIDQNNMYFVTQVLER